MLSACRTAGMLAAGLVFASSATAAARVHNPEYGDDLRNRESVVAAIRTRQEDPGQTIDEFDEMVLVTDLDDWRLEHFIRRVLDRHETWNEWMAGEKQQRLEALQAQLRQARRDGDQKQVEKLQRETEPLQRAHTELRTRIRRNVVTAMTYDQQRDWAAFVLWGHWGGLRGRFRDVDLSEDQLWRAHAVCRQEVWEFVKGHTLAVDPYLWVFRRGGDPIRDRIAERIAREVLTPDQRKMMSFARAPRASRSRVVALIEKRREDPEQKIDEFDEMVLVTDMDGRQLGAFLEAVKERHAKWGAYTEGEAEQKRQALRGQLDAAKKAGDPKRIAAIEKQLEPLEKAHQDYRAKVRADVVEVMTLPQQRDWAAFVLWGHWGKLRWRFRRLDLSDRQVERAREICRDEMDRLVQRGTMEADPYLFCIRGRGEEVRALKDRVADRIAQQVLSRQQREKYQQG